MLNLRMKLPNRNTEKERAQFKERIVEEYVEFLGNETGNDAELTWLFRFERSIVLAKSYINGNRNKGLFLAVGNLLEGSDDFTRYITGGHSSKETKRRVLLIEHLCDIKPRKRTRKLAIDAPISNKKEKKEVFDNNVAESSSLLLQLATTAAEVSGLPISVPGFNIDRVIEENAAFRIFEARKVKTFAEVKLKVFNRDMMTAFYQEVDILHYLNQQDFIVTMVEYADYPPTTLTERYIAFENIGNRTLLELVKADENTIINVSLDILEALKYVHNNEIIVRNLRPDAIYLWGPEHNLRIKIGDFTHAVHHPQSQAYSMPREDGAERSQDIEDLLFLSPLCQAPELYSSQYSGLDYSQDMWSFGMILFILISGYLPVKEIENIQENVDSLDDSAVRSLVQGNGIPEKIQNVLSLILTMKPSARKTVVEIDSIIRSTWPKRSNVSLSLLTLDSGSKSIQTTLTFYRHLVMGMVVSRFSKLKDLKDPDLEASQKISIFKKTVLSIITANRLQKESMRSLTNGPITTIEPAPVMNSTSAVLAPASEDKLINRGRYLMMAPLVTGNDFTLHAGLLTAINGKVFIKKVKGKNVQYESELSILKILNNHPSISKFHDCIEENFDRFFIVERLDDGCLIDVMNSPVPLNEAAVKSVAKGLLEGLNFIHSKNILLRGLSLSSVTMKMISADEVIVKIWNFHTAAFTNVEKLCNKPFAPSLLSVVDSYFLAPELLQSILSGGIPAFYDGAVDVWSLGVVLYALTEKKSPFVIGSPPSVYTSVVTSSVNFVSKTLSNEGREAVRTMLTVSADRRTEMMQSNLTKWVGLGFNGIRSNPLIPPTMPSYSSIGVPALFKPSYASLPTEPMQQLPQAHGVGASILSSLSFSGGVSSMFPSEPPVKEESLNGEDAQTKKYEEELKKITTELINQRSYALIYFKFLQAVNVDNGDLADSLYNDLNAIDPHGEEKMVYKDEESFRNAAIEASKKLEEMISFYKSVPKDKIKAYGKVKEIRDLKTIISQIPEDLQV